MSALSATLAELCAKCPHVAIAWCAPHDAGFALQGVVTTRQRSDTNNRGWTIVDVVHSATSAEATREIADVAHAISKRHPRAIAHVVSYTFTPGRSWTVAFRGST